MKKLLSLMAYALMMSSILVSCGGDDDKKEDEPEETTAPAPASPSYEYTGSAGFLAAINTVTVTPGMDLGNGFVTPETTIGFVTASAGFWDTPGATLKDAGAVTFAGQSLTKADNNAYYYSGGEQGFTGTGGIAETDAKAWTVASPAISYTNTKDYPKVTAFSSMSKTVTKGSDLTLDWGGNTGAPDSIYVGVISYEGPSVFKTVAGSVSSATFTAAELEVLTGSQAMIQVTPYNWNKQNISGKDYYFINQTTYTDINGEIK